MMMEKFVKLTEAERSLILERDTAAYPITSRASRNWTIARNRARNNDIVFIAVAVRNIKKERRLKIIGITSIDSKREVFSGEMALVNPTFCLGWRVKVGWCEIDLKKDGEQFAGAKYSAMYWFDKDNHKSIWSQPTKHFYFRYLPSPMNIGEVVAANPRFRYCALPDNHDPIAWLRLYKVAPEIENLSKMNLTHLASLKFIEKLRGDRQLLAYIRQNLADISRHRIGGNDLIYAAKHSLSAQKFLAYKLVRDRTAQLKSFLTREVGKGILPKDFDYREASAFLTRTRISPWEYQRYIHFCLEAGADVLDPHTATPNRLEQRLAEFEKLVDKRRKARERAERKRKAELVKERDTILAELAKRYARAVARLKTSGYEIVFPDSSKAFTAEGRAMDNCIGGGNYTIRHADGDCVCVFIRLASAPSKPFVDVEIVNGKVRQCYAKHNSTADAETQKLAKKIAKALFKKSVKKAA